MVMKKTIAMGGAAALLVSIPFIGQWEGKSNTPYKDIVGVTTVCYGETRVPMKTYTDEECSKMLSDAVERDFMKPVADMTPTIKDSPYQLASATSLAYNIGIGAYKGSTVRKRFLAGDFKGACNAFLSWNKIRRLGKLVESRGLTNRRKAERELCLTGL